MVASQFTMVVRSRPFGDVLHPLLKDQERKQSGVTVDKRNTRVRLTNFICNKSSKKIIFILYILVFNLAGTLFSLFSVYLKHVDI